MINSKKKKIILFVCAAIVGLIIAFCVGRYVFNKVKDDAPVDKVIFESDFNQSQGGLITDAYSVEATTTLFAYEESGGMDDSRCLSIENFKENDSRFILKVTDAREDTYYRISVWVKTENVGSNDKQVGANISILNTQYRSYTYSGNQDWTLLEFFGKTGENQTSFDVCLRLGFYSGINTGKVWFDDLCVEQISTLPKGVIAYSMTDTMSSTTTVRDGERIKNETHDDTLFAGLIIFVVATAIILIGMKYASNKDKGILSKPEISSASVTWSVIILILIGFVVRVIGSVSLPQCDIDVNLFKYWGSKAAEIGITDFYNHAEAINLDYPPLFMYWLWFLGKICSIFNIGTASLFATFLMKLPSMIADCVIAFFIYKWCNNLQKANRNWIIIVVSMWLFNPLVILDSTAWGQVDSLLTMFILGAVYWITQEKYIPSSIALAFAVALKPQGIMLIPILGYALFKILVGLHTKMKVSKRIMLIVKCIAVFSGAFLVIMLPFGIKMEPNIFKWIYDLYIGTVDGYEYATVNAFNFYYLVGKNWAPDNEVIMMFFGKGITLHHIGMVMIVGFAVLAWVLYMFADTKRKPYLTYLIAAMLLYGVVTFGPRMHERYFFPVILLMLFAAILANNKILLGLFGLTTMSNFFTVLEVMTGLKVGQMLKDTDYDAMAYFYWNHQNFERNLMAAINVITCIALTVITIMLVFNMANFDNKRYRIWSESGEYERGRRR